MHVAKASIMIPMIQESQIAPGILNQPALPNSQSVNRGNPHLPHPRPHRQLSTEFAFKGAELSHCLMRAGSSEVAGEFHRELI